MSKYTMELREFFTPIKYNPPLMTRIDLENVFKSYELTDYLTSEQIEVIENAGIWNKDRLARKIVDNYYMHEIGFDTIGLFIHYAKIEMEKIMEEYLPLIYSASIEYDPLINVDYSETFEGAENTDNSINSSTSGTSGSNSTNNSSGLVVSSNTPQGQISKTSILNGSYASETSANEDSSTITNSTNVSNTGSETSTSDKTNSYTKHMIGNSGISATAQKLIEQYRNNIRAIDREIIDKLNILFMGIW